MSTAPNATDSSNADSHSPPPFHSQLPATRAESRVPRSAHPGHYSVPAAAPPGKRAEFAECAAHRQIQAQLGDSAAEAAAAAAAERSVRAAQLVMLMAGCTKPVVGCIAKLLATVVAAAHSSHPVS